jgi:hypothetical protein
MSSGIWFAVLQLGSRYDSARFTNKAPNCGTLIWRQLFSDQRVIKKITPPSKLLKFFCRSFSLSIYSLDPTLRVTTTVQNAAKKEKK